MSTISYIIEANTANFADVVVEKSKTIPVLVDFWADWCGPCRSLMPILAKLADEYAGQFFLAKVNTDQEQDLAMQYGVRSLPTVKLFRDGEVVDEFMGALPENNVRAFIDSAIPNESEMAAEKALEQHRNGDSTTAIAKLKAILQSEAENDRVRLTLARIYMELGQIEDAVDALGGVSAKSRSGSEYRNLKETLKFAKVASNAPSEEQLEQIIAADPGNAEARYQLSARLLTQQRFEPAMEQLLELVRRDRRYGEDAGRKSLLSIFDLLGNQDSRVVQYRGKLTRAIL